MSCVYFWIWTKCSNLMWCTINSTKLWIGSDPKKKALDRIFPGNCLHDLPISIMSIIGSNESLSFHCLMYIKGNWTQIQRSRHTDLNIESFIWPIWTQFIFAFRDTFFSLQSTAHCSLSIKRQVVQAKGLKLALKGKNGCTSSTTVGYSATLTQQC